MDEETLRRTAYRIWEEQGRPHGQDFEHWLQAQREQDDNADANDGLPGSVATSVTPPGMGRVSQEGELASDLPVESTGAPDRT
nr:DUF2934 domain-containing protein [uncultured Pseudomonas sp.]